MNHEMIIVETDVGSLGIVIFFSPFLCILTFSIIKKVEKNVIKKSFVKQISQFIWHNR